jgi:hypothetical protein
MRRFGTRFLTATLFALLVSPLFVSAQRPQPGGGGFAMTPDRLLANKSVQEELKLTEEQIKKFDGVREKYKDELAKAREAKDFKALQEIGKKVSEDITKLSGDVLKPDQVKRFHQIQVQVAGLRAFEREDVKTALKLTDKQVEEIKALAGEVEKDAAELRKDAGMDKEKRDAAQKKITEMRAKALAKATEGLKDDQKKAFTELTGAKFELKIEPRRPNQ